MNTFLGGTFGFFNNGGNMHLPMTASNLETRYETHIIATINSTKYIGF